MKTLAIITARGGSKRIPRKNIKPFLGKPIIQYSIEAALQSNCFDEVMVSTDDKEIAELSVKNGAVVPFMRSEKTSNDFATTSEVILEVLSSYKLKGIEFEHACCIYPTAPFVTSEKLNTVFKMLKESDAKSVIPVTSFSFPILRSCKIENNKLLMNWPEHTNTRSQDLPRAYHDSGQFYFIRVDSFMLEKKVFTDNTLGFIVPETEVQDIDNEEDWKIAEIKYSFLLQKKENHV
ncbi:MAG: pseudaminic acid cytidylyltransferase [Bacteroidia bacterium]